MTDIVIPLFNRIELDPPWPEQGGGKSKRGARYAMLSIDEIADVVKASPLWKPDPAGCHVWMWCVSHRTAKGEGAAVMAALGVRMVRKLVWVKDRAGLGQYARGRHEDLLLGVIGALPPLPSAKSTDDVIVAPVPRNTENRPIHSRKPWQAITKMDLITPLGNTAELFARVRRESAWTWGRLDGEEQPIVFAPPTKERP